MKHTGLFGTLFFLVILLTACAESSTDPSGGIEFEAVEPRNQGISIPASPRVAPSDILDQVVFEGTGGNNGEKWCPCVYVDSGTLYLEGFSPDQSLRLVAYDEYEQYYGSYYSEWPVTVDSSGSLAVSLNGYTSNYTFIAFDPETGEQEGPMNRVVYPNPISAEEAQSETAQISSQVEGVNMRSSPGFSGKNDSADVIAILASGDTVEIIEGPSSADGLQWWLVSWNGYEGWIAESTKNGRTILEFNP